MADRYQQKGVRGGTSAGSKYRAKRLREAAKAGEVPTTRGSVKIGKNPSAKKEVAKQAAKEAGKLVVEAVALKGLGKVAKGIKAGVKAARGARKATGRVANIQRRSRDLAEDFMDLNTPGARRAAYNARVKAQESAVTRRVATKDKLLKDNERYYSKTGKYQNRGVEKIKKADARRRYNSKMRYDTYQDTVRKETRGTKNYERYGTDRRRKKR